MKIKISFFFLLLFLGSFVSGCKESDPGADGNVYMRFSNNEDKYFCTNESDEIPGVPRLDSPLLNNERLVQTQAGTYTIVYIQQENCNANDGTSNCDDPDDNCKLNCVDSTDCSASSTVEETVTFEAQEGEESQVTNIFTDNREVDRGGKGRDNFYTLSFGETKITIIYEEGSR